MSRQDKRVLELNMDHPLLVKIKAVYEKDKDADALKDYTELLFDMAVISEGGNWRPSRFSKLLGDLMVGALDG